MPRYSKTNRQDKKKIIKCLVPDCPSYSTTFNGLGDHMGRNHRYDFNIYDKDCPICPFSVNKKEYKTTL